MKKQYYIENPPIHTCYAGCRQEIKWCVDAIVGGESDGYIIQRVSRKCTVPQIIGNESYFEAWRVKDGCIYYNNDSKYEYDDVFSVGIMDTAAVFRHEETLECIIHSVNTSGTISFRGKVYWCSLKNDTELFSIVSRWDYGAVKSAGDLQSSYYFPEAGEIDPVFERRFQHQWSFIDDAVIFNTLKSELEKFDTGNTGQKKLLKFYVERPEYNDCIRIKLRDCFKDHTKDIRC